MTGCPRRIAVQPGASGVRLAGAGPDDPPRVLAELPAGDPGGLLTELLEERPVELTVLHPSSWPPARATAWAQGAAGLAERVRAVPLALMVGAAVPRVVVDAGHGGVEITLLGPDGVRATRTCDAGGARLDAITLDLLRSAVPDAADRATLLHVARRVRERLSLLPTASAALAGERVRVDAGELRRVLAAPFGDVVDAVGGLLGNTRPAEIVLVGGVARTPLLAELMDAAELGPVRVPARPEAEALLGALREPAPAVAAAGAGGGWITAQARPGAPGVPVGLEPGRGARATGRRAAAERAPGRAAAEPACGRAAAEPAFRWLPPVPPRPRRPLRIAVAAAAGVAVAGALLAGVLPGPPTAASGDAPPAGVLVQYGYRIDLPAGWEHTGGLPERRRTLITPVTAPDGSDLISVERSDLGYDANAEPDRALRELRAEFDAAVAGGAPLTGFDSAARVAGRPGAGYQQVMGGGAVVDWFVVLDRGAQLSVGCQHTAAGAAAVERACAAVVGSLRLQ